MHEFETLESEVRSYCRSFPAVFARSRGHEVFDEAGRRYLDFFSGAGALNYGHNEPRIRDALVAYLQDGGVLHALDMATVAKRAFLTRFAEVILRPRNLSFKVQFPGPTGTNAVEAALKLARKVTGRTSVIGFTNGYHGMTLGALAVTGNAKKRRGAGVPLPYAHTMPFDGYLGTGVDTLDYLDKALSDPSSGIDAPAAFIVETVQAEGGVNVASDAWLTRLAAIAKRHGTLLVIDDIQVGCGRTGPFFSFEPSGIHPDIVCLSKSISGCGLPLALVLMRPEIDAWSPGEHNGTFRGNNLAFVGATAALSYWEDDALSRAVAAKSALVRARLERIVARAPAIAHGVRGRGLILGMECAPGVAEAISAAAFPRGLIVETAGATDQVLKILPPLVIPEAALEEGLDVIERCALELASRPGAAKAEAQGLA